VKDKSIFMGFVFHVLSNYHHSGEFSSFIKISNRMILVGVKAHQHNQLVIIIA